MLDKMPGDAWQKYATLRALYGYMYGAPGQEAAVHGRRVRPVARVEPRSQPRLASARRSARTRRCGATSRRSNCALPRRAGAARAGLRPVGLPLDRLQRQREQRRRRSCATRAIAAIPWSMRLQLHAGAARRTTASACPQPGYYAELLNSDSALFGGSNVGNGGGVRDRAGRRARLRPVDAPHRAAARVPDLKNAEVGLARLTKHEAYADSRELRALRGNCSSCCMSLAHDSRVARRRAGHASRPSPTSSRTRLRCRCCRTSAAGSARRPR